MRKLIETKQEFLLQCDYPSCGYKIPYTEEGYVNLKTMIDSSCPTCGRNLLTKQNYDNYMKIVNSIRFVNKWFSWLTIFIPKNAKGKKMVAHAIHNSIKIEEK